jgi:hypothetical protein
MSETIQKAVFNKNQLPAISFSTAYNSSTNREEIDELFYLARYRVTSEDRNRQSHWSKVFKIVLPPLPTTAESGSDYFPYSGSSRISIRKSGNPEVITVVWTPKTQDDGATQEELEYLDLNSFDVWIRWNETDTEDENDVGWKRWNFQGTVTDRTWAIIKPTAEKSIDVAIQIPTEKKIRDYNNNRITLFRGIAQGI